jgi:chromosome segregation ATPase
MSLRDAYCQKLDAQIEELNARLALARAKGKRLAAEGKIAAAEEFADAEKKLLALKRKLKALGNASESACAEMKGGLEKAWSDLSEAAKRAFEKYDQPTPAGHGQPPAADGK